MAFSDVSWWDGMGWEMFPGGKTQTVAADTHKMELGAEVGQILPVLHPGGGRGGFLWASCWSICISAE